MKPTNRNQSWHLEDVINRHNQDPRFNIPSEDERSSITEGTLVKLIFVSDTEDEPGAERMWVEVKTLGVNYTGLLDNDPTIIKNLSSGDSISFNNNNILDIYIEN